MELSTAQREALLSVARQSVEHGLRAGEALRPALGDYDGALVEAGACFVTLNLHGELKGCMGSLEAHRPLVEDVAENAFNAAFRDPRFHSVEQSELEILELHISVLSAPQPFEVEDEPQLLQTLRPGVDGLVLREERRRATFLPSVWESLPDPQDFVNQLKRKAGLPLDYWSDRLRFERYQVLEIP